MKKIKNLLLIVVSFGVMFSFAACSNKSDETETIVEKTASCTLVVDVKAFGWTDDGKDLSDNWSESLIVNTGDSVYETERGGHYIIDGTEKDAGVVFAVKSIDENAVTIEINSQDRAISFDEQIEVESLVYAYDGQNYKYTIHFEK